jgi:acyl carrier protein
LELTDSVPQSTEDPLKALPGHARQAYQRFLQTGGTADLDAVIHAAIGLYLPAGSAVDVAGIPEDAALVDDMGFDSLGMTELVFFTEDLFGITIEDAELLGLRTLRDLKGFVRAKLRAAGIRVAQT